MSDSNNPSHLQPSSELVRWLQSLALPIWARSLMVIVLFAVLLGGMAMIAWALLHQDRETMTAGVGLLTVALPVSLLVIGLVFGQRSEKRLNTLTAQVLEALIPQQIGSIVCTPRQLQITISARAGCRFTYLLSNLSDDIQTEQGLKFSVELNVRKVNLMFFLSQPLTRQEINLSELHRYQHVIAGAKAEGYTLNDQVAEYSGEDGGQALLFFKKLPDDFLLRPIEKLYFTQDLAFFVRGILEAQTSSASFTQVRT